MTDVDMKDASKGVEEETKKVEKEQKEPDDLFYGKLPDPPNNCRAKEVAGLT